VAGELGVACRSTDQVLQMKVDQRSAAFNPLIQKWWFWVLIALTTLHQRPCTDDQRLVGDNFAMVQIRFHGQLRAGLPV
jgi:hypothetical protein